MGLRVCRASPGGFLKESCLIRDHGLKGFMGGSGCRVYEVYMPIGLTGLAITV